MSSVSLNRPINPSSCYVSPQAPMRIHANDACGQILLRQAALAQEEAQQKKKQAHHKLNSVEMPFCVALGFMIYQVGLFTDPSHKVMKRFEKLLTQNQELRGSVSKINISLVRDQGSVPPKLRLPLSQLDGLLHANDIPPSTMYPYMEQVRQLANGGNPKIQHIGRQVGEYQSLLQTLMRDKPGFTMLANEMRVRRFMDVSKKQAMDLARTDREGFFVKLFGRGLSKDEYLLRYKTMFEQLGESHRLRIRLAAFVIPGLLFGYFFSKVGKADEASHQQ